MAPFNCDSDPNKKEINAWTLDGDPEYWESVTRRSSFSDINRSALTTSKNSSNTSGYAREFRRYLRNEKRRLNAVHFHSQLQNQNSITRFISWTWQHKFNRILDDWLTLAMLGVSMAFLSVGVDKGIALCSSGKFRGTHFHTLLSSFKNFLKFSSTVAIS